MRNSLREGHLGRKRRDNLRWYVAKIGIAQEGRREAPRSSRKTTIRTLATKITGRTKRVLCGAQKKKNQGYKRKRGGEKRKDARGSSTGINRAKRVYRSGPAKKAGDCSSVKERSQDALRETGRDEPVEQRERTPASHHR